ncbi:MAG: DUF1846 domain-containing protein [Pseudomonadota bacterium]
MPQRQPAPFDNARYQSAQVAGILDRVERCGTKLYLEVGGKLLKDYHAARVLPGFDPDVKLRSLQRLADRLEVLFCVNAKDLQAGRIRGDFGTTYYDATLRTLDDLMAADLPVTAVIITRYRGQDMADMLKRRLSNRGMRVFLHRDVPGYPHDVPLVASPNGFGINAYVPTRRPLVVVAGAGPGSGKIETALHQMWHDQAAGRTSGFAKWETFPVWDLAPDHPLNLAYEAATADLRDRNLIDPFHLEAYGVAVTNYNRDIEHFPVLRALLDHLYGAGTDLPRYRSPTDMCINRVSVGMLDEAAISAASHQEIIRRYLRYRWERVIGRGRDETVEVARELMRTCGLEVEDRPVVRPARQAAEAAREDPRKGHRGAWCGAAMQLPEGSIVTGSNSPLLYSTAAVVINAVKRLGGIQPDLPLLSSLAIQHMVRLEHEVLGGSSECLDIAQALKALSIVAAYNPAAQACFEQLASLRRCELHMTHLPTESDQLVLRQLGIMFTTDALLAPGDDLYA